jgi:hypothetical protein
MNNNINELNNYISTNNEIQSEDVKYKKSVNTLIPSGNASYLSINNQLPDNLKLFTSPLLSILPDSILNDFSGYFNSKDDNKIGEENTKGFINKLENNYLKKGLKKIRKVLKSNYFSVANFSNILGEITNNVMDTLNIPSIKLVKPEYILDNGVKVDEKSDCKKLRNREVEIVFDHSKRKLAKPTPVDKNSKEYKKNIKILKNQEKKVISSIGDTEKEFKKQQEKKLAEYYKVNKDILKEAQTEAKSFLVDKKLNDSKAITVRLKSILEYKENKVDFFRKYIIANINSEDINRYQVVIQIVNFIIEENDKFYVFKNYVDAKLITKNLIKNKNNISYINKRNSKLTDNESIKTKIVNALTISNYKKLFDIVKTTVKNRKNIVRFNSDAKTEVDEIFNLIRLGKMADVNKKVEYILSLNNHVKYEKEILYQLKHKNLDGIQSMIYLILHEKEYDVRRSLLEAATKLKIVLDNYKLFLIKKGLMLSKPTGEAALFARELNNTIMGKMIMEQLLKDSKKNVSFVKNIITKITTPTTNVEPDILHIKNFDYIKIEEIKSFIPEAIKLENVKYNFEKKLLIDNAKKINLDINDNNYENMLLKMSAPSTNVEPIIKQLISNLESQFEGTILLNNIKNKVENAIKYTKYCNASKLIKKLRRELKNLKINSIKTNVNQDIQKLIQLKKDYSTAKELRELVKDFVLKSYAVEEMKFLLEVGKMKESEAIKNFDYIKDTLKNENKNDENIKDVISNAYNVAKKTKDKFSRLRKEIKKIGADMNKQLNLATIKLDAFLKLESNNKMINLLNAQDRNIESTKITTDHLKNMHLKQIVINNQNSIDKNKMAGGYYIDYNINRTITDNDVIKYGAIDPKIAQLMDKLKDGQTSLVVATIAVLLEKGLKLKPNKFGKCPQGQFDFSNVPEWTKRAIDSIPELGDLIDKIGNNLCMKKKCPMKNSHYSQGLCYPVCKHSYKADKGLMCWKKYNGFEVNKENPELLNKKLIYNSGSIPRTCDKHEDLIGYKCVPKCKKGYIASGFSCIKKCADGTIEDGRNCVKKQYDRGIGKLPSRKECPPNYRTDKLTCLKNDKCEKWWDECKKKDKNGNCIPGLSTTCIGPKIIEREKFCKKNQEMINGLCYNKCKEGYDSYGSICFSKAESYTRDSYDRVATLAECPENFEKINGVCYRKCPSGYTMDKPGVCIQTCPKDTIDNRTSCIRTGYKRDGGKLEISIYKKPSVEKFSNISNILDFYGLEHYSNIGVVQPFESSFQHDSNYLFESFFNVDAIAANIPKIGNFDLNLIASNIKNKFNKVENFSVDSFSTLEFNNKSFDTNRKYNHEFSDEDIAAGKKYEKDGFFGLDRPRMEGSYTTNDTKNFPIIKKNRSDKYVAYLEYAGKNYIEKKNRPIDKNYIVEPKMGGFAMFDLSLKPNSDEFLKTSYVKQPDSHPEMLPWDIQLYSTNERSNNYSKLQKRLNEKEEVPVKSDYYSPLLGQIVKEMVNSFPVAQNHKTEMTKDIRELITKVKKEINESDFKNKREYKNVLKQIYIKGPVVTVVPNLSEG